MQKRSPSPRKALAYLLLGFLGLLAILSAVIYLTVIHPIKSYVSAKPYPLAHLPVSEVAEQAVRNKAAAFFRDKARDSLVLNSEEMNHLIRTNPRIAEYGVNYHVTLEESLFNVKCSAPVSSIPNQLSRLVDLLDFEGYVNAEIEGYARIRNGELRLISTRAQLGGRSVPFGLLGKRTHIDVGKFFRDRAQYETALGMLNSINIRNGRLTVVKK